MPPAVSSILLPPHILAGVLALVLGYVALSARKGAPLHRKAGLGFVLTMACMSLTGAWIALLNSNSRSFIAGLMTFYFVATSFLTLRRHLASRAIDIAAMIFAVIVALFAIQAGLTSPRAIAIPMFIFATMGLLAAVYDLRLIRQGPIAGRSRITRHLWRMCLAMWVAAVSFFWGPPNRVPEWIRYPDFYPIPVLFPLAVMFYWLWRLRGPSTAPNQIS